MSAPRALISRCRVRFADLVKKSRFWRNQSGGAAIDFALVMLPFLAVLMAIIESAIVLFAGQVLQTGNVVASCFTFTAQPPGGNVGAAINVIGSGAGPTTVTFFEYQ